MPELPDDLAAMLRARAEHAPEPPAPSAGLVRTVRRRQALRAGAAVAACTVGVVAVVALAAGAARPERPARVTPVETPPPTAYADRYEFCTGTPALSVHVAIHPGELKFDRGCYVVKAGITVRLDFTNATSVPHNVVVAPDGGEPFVKTDIIKDGRYEAINLGALRKGDYSLTCMVHPAMHAQLIAR